MSQSYNKLEDDMDDQLSALTRDRDNSLLMAENERQQVWIIFSISYLYWNL